MLNVVNIFKEPQMTMCKIEIACFPWRVNNKLLFLANKNMWVFRVAVSNKVLKNFYFRVYPPHFYSC